MHGVYQELKALIALITVWQITETVTFCETTAKCWRGSTVTLHSDIIRLWWTNRKRATTVRDVHRQTVTMMDIQPSSTGQVHLLRLQIQLLGCRGSAVQGLHIYGSVVDGTGGGGSEQTERTSQRQWKDGCQGPVTIQGGWGHSCNWGGVTFSFASTLSAGWATAAWYLQKAHGFVTTAGPDMIIQLCFQFN